jgi:hypothetical protein
MEKSTHIKKFVDSLYFGHLNAISEGSNAFVEETCTPCLILMALGLSGVAVANCPGNHWDAKGTSCTLVMNVLGCNMPSRISAHSSFAAGAEVTSTEAHAIAPAAEALRYRRQRIS